MEGIIQDYGPGFVRPMSYQVGPIFNPKGINLEVVLGHNPRNLIYELPRVSSADIIMGKFIRERDSLSSSREIDEQRDGHIQSYESSALRKFMVEENTGLLQEGEVHTSLQLENGRLERPRKRGRPKKSKVIVKAVAKAVDLPSSTFFRAGQLLFSPRSCFCRGPDPSFMIHDGAFGLLSCVGGFLCARVASEGVHGEDGLREGAIE
ncbi:hypothetical protein Dimus_030827, partial [Dionaea muscipula]